MSDSNHTHGTAILSLFPGLSSPPTLICRNSWLSDENWTPSEKEPGVVFGSFESETPWDDLLDTFTCPAGPDSIRYSLKHGLKSGQKWELNWFKRKDGSLVLGTPSKCGKDSIRTVTDPKSSNNPASEATSVIVQLTAPESKKQLADLKGSRNPEQRMFSLTVSRTDEIDSIVPFSVHRPPGHTWYISRVEMTPADDGPEEVWQKYHASGVSVRGEFPKFGSSSKIAENIGAHGKWGSKLCNIKRVNEEKTNVWSVLHKSVTPQ